MAVTVKEITLWRREVVSQPGVLAHTLEPLVGAGADLQVLMAYRYPGDRSRGAIEVFPVTTRKAAAAAEAAGLGPAGIPVLLVQGDNRAGLGAAVARALADAGINIDFLVAQVVGRRYSAVYGFEADADRKKAVSLIKRARPAGKKR